MGIYESPLPCRGNEALYDLVLFDEDTSAERQQAVHRAAALCGSCPFQCDQKVTIGTERRELVLLEAGWMPPEREGKAEPEPRASSRRRKQDPDVQVGADYVATGRRVAVWAEMCADRAALGCSVVDIAAELCVSEDTAVQLIAVGRKARGWAA